MNNDLEQFSEERLIKLSETKGFPPLGDVRALARIALAAKQAKPTFEEWLSSRTGTIEVDCGCVTTEAFYHWLKVAYEATPHPAHTEQNGWVSIPKDMLADYRDVKNSELQSYKASFGSHCDIPRSRWQRDLADLTEELAEIDKLLAAAPKPEGE